MYRTRAGSAVAALTHRNILKNLRNPDIIVFATAAPVAFALLFAFVFGSAMEMDGAVYREYLLVGIIAQTMLTTATNTGVGLAHDARDGMTDRFRSLPVNPLTVLVARTNSDLIMNVLVIVILAIVGLVMGWRTRSTPWEAAAGFGVLLLFAYALSWVTAYVGLKVRSPEVLSNVSLLFLLPLAFVSTAFVPTGGMPPLMRTIAEWNPVSAVVTGVRQLFGNMPPEVASPDIWPLQNPLVASLTASALLLAIFIPLSAHAFTKQNQR
jgi:ABC-2 type transport system permease protein